MAMREYLEKGYYIRTVPSYIAQRCLDRKSGSAECRVCVDICPQGIYPSGKRKRPIWDQCLKCGLCAAACPSRCITPVSGQVEKYLLGVTGKSDFSIGCDRKDGEYALTVSCIAEISWEQMAYAALKNGITISLRECQGCSEERNLELINENLNKLLTFLGEELFDERVKILAPGDKYEYQGEQVSRRELFSFFSNNPLDKAFNALPEITESADSSLFYRFMLRDGVKEFKKTERGKDAKFTVRLPHITNKCYGCGTCVRMCPTKALSIINKDGMFTVAVEAFRCTECGICQDKCWAGGIDTLAAMKISQYGKVAIAKLKEHLCPQCGKIFSYNTGVELCPTCAAKKRVADRKKAAEQAEQNKAAAEQ